jgi:hypothetical protein
MCQLMMLENISLTMHDDKLRHEISANIFEDIFEESSLVGSRYILA